MVAKYEHMNVRFTIISDHVPSTKEGMFSQVSVILFKGVGQVKWSGDRRQMIHGLGVKSGSDGQVVQGGGGVRLGGPWSRVAPPLAGGIGWSQNVSNFHFHNQE